MSLPMMHRICIESWSCTAFLTSQKPFVNVRYFSTLSGSRIRLVHRKSWGLSDWVTGVEIHQVLRGFRPNSSWPWQPCSRRSLQCRKRFAGGGCSRATTRKNDVRCGRLWIRMTTYSPPNRSQPNPQWVVGFAAKSALQYLLNVYLGVLILGLKMRASY